MHSVNLLALWLWLLILLPWLERHYLFALSICVTGLALCFARQRLLRSLPRLKWLFLSILLVYGWTVPGKYFWLGWLSPTDAGLILGLDQVARLLVVISSLQMLLARMTRAEIFTSVYIFLWPLKYFNHMQSRFAVRFALTLEKAEDLLEAKKGFSALMALILLPQVQNKTEYALQYSPLDRLQRMFFVGQSILILLTISMGVGGFWN